MIDFHVHSDYSADAKNTMKEMAASAARRGITHLCFTDHVDIGHKHREFARFPNKEYITEEFAEASAKSKVNLYLGLEIADNFRKRDIIVSELKYWKLDYHLLSLHMVDGTDCYDARYFQRRPREKTYRLYLEALLESAVNFPDYDGFAHIGYCGRYAPYLPKSENPLRYSDGEDVIDEILKTLINRDKALEINGSGLLRGSVTMPETTILRRYRELGGENIITGSDAHRSIDSGKPIRECYELAQSLGFKYVCRYENRVRFMESIEKALE
ncbi:MAG: histidinol-phosphatase HisJ family protein [Eubacteriales bacterium]|nr:histidinol-phosphatase HisJ family protein [Eubacteriales bacterium]MDD3881106.1 histidinol-phosphatase HisJ family protein [Eubacteriales bacterium]MDD4511488.1 histidinol-phosphatase HisJ family protein [Eubacteriales bacterium]